MDYEAKVSVIYADNKKPYPTSPADIVKWLQDNYQEHIVQIEQLVKLWKNNNYTRI